MSKIDILRKKLRDSRFEKGTIFILTDDVNLKNIFRLLFKDTGYKLLFETNGINGLKRLEKKGIKLIILAIQLPDMSGLDMIHKLRFINGEIKTLLIDNFGVPEIMQQTLNFGKEYLIRKPFIPEHILKSVYKVLN